MIKRFKHKGLRELFETGSKKGDSTMLMHTPPHPGELIRDICLKPLDLNVTEAAKGLGVTRKTLSSLLNWNLFPYSLQPVSIVKYRV
jgi:hypothetical protein